MEGLPQTQVMSFQSVEIKTLDSKNGYGDSTKNMLASPVLIKSAHLSWLMNDVILRKLFGRMNFDSLKICRQVCRKWDSIIDPIFKESTYMAFGFDQIFSYPYNYNVDFCKTERQACAVEQQILEYASLDNEFTCFKFEGGNIPWQGEVIQDFFKEHGDSIKELAVNFFWSITTGKIDDFFDFVNLVLLKHVFKVQALHIMLHINRDSGVNEMVAYDSSKKFEYFQSLLQLKVFSLKLPYGPEELIPEREKIVFQKLFGYILSSSKNLMTVEMAIPMTLNACQSLSEESYFSLKHIRISYEDLVFPILSLRHYYDQDIPYPEDPRFVALMKISEKGVQLQSLSLILNMPKETREYVCPSLVAFLQTQSAYLEKLEINVTTDFCFQVIRPYFPILPTMDKVHTLIISDDTYALSLPFQDRNLARQFPVLKKIQIIVPFGRWEEKSSVKLVRNFLKSFDVAGEKLEFFHLCISGWLSFYKFKMNNVSLRKCVACFKLAKLKIPNLTEFKISILNLPNMVCYRGNYETSVVVI